MYSAVSTSDYEFADTMEINDRESLYFDTISVAGSEPNRKSLSISRQTIYHSAVDLPAAETETIFSSTATLPTITDHNENENFIHQEQQQKHNTNINTKPIGSAFKSNHINRHSSPPVFRQQSPLIDVGDYRDNILMYGKFREIEAIKRGGETSLAGGTVAEVTTSLLNNNSNKIKKLPITYSQWKSRTWRKFDDCERSVDFVLAYNGKEKDLKKINYRKIFERNLIEAGLELEYDERQETHFIKIHAPVSVLKQYCEILKIKLPIRKIAEQDNISQPEFELMAKCKTICGRPFRFIKLDPKIFPPQEYRLMFEYSSTYDYLFDSNDPKLFDSSRSMVINFILERTACKDEKELCGIEDMIKHGIIDAAYPLHDGDIDTIGSQRKLLMEEWASINKFMKHQPLDNIKDYFGVKIALYFAWLGFYTHMLIPASIFGLICFFYGVFTLSSDRLSQDICDDNNTILMCPLCDVKCDYWYLRQTCIYSKMNYLFDNKLTVVFAFFMSFWAVLYLELWKRYSTKLIHRWGLTDYTPQVEFPRRKYLERVKNLKHTKFNVVHQVLEPHVPFWKYKFPVHFATFSTVIMFICLSLAAIFGSVIYRMSTTTSRNIYGEVDSTSYKVMAQPITAAIIDLIVITILDYCYNYLAEFLTDLEYRRTQADYDESLSLKIYMFQFVNYYSSLFYIALLKGKFVGYPAKYNRIFNLRQEECNPGGCLMELCIQLIIIMIGKQAINALLEMLLPYLIKTFKTIKQRFSGSFERIATDRKQTLVTCNQWTEDYKLLPWTQRDLFNEYLEMILQFGFITIFVVAFPLAPFFALCNNVFEMRLDAKKYLKFYQRPVPQRIKDIGVWYNILAIVSRIAVASSAFIIAFSTNLIPKLIYSAVVSKNHTDEGYLDHTLAHFNIEDFQEGTKPLHTNFSNVTECRYAEYRNPPSDPHPYKRPLIYWHILAARLAFFVIFQNVVGVIQTLVAWAIPDVPGKLRNQIKREEHLTREVIINEETRRRIHEHDHKEGFGNNYNQKSNKITEQHNAAPSSNKNGSGVIISRPELHYIDEDSDQSDILRKRLKPEHIVDRTTPV